MRDPKILIEDIMESIEKVEEYTKGLLFEQFVENTIVVDAVVRNLEIIGEASKRIPSDIQDKNKSIPWNQLKGIRNRIVHEYFDIDPQIIWHIVTVELTPLKVEINELAKLL